MAMAAAMATDMGFNASKTLLGIETNINGRFFSASAGFKASKTLLGIETNSPRR